MSVRSQTYCAPSMVGIDQLKQDAQTFLQDNPLLLLDDTTNNDDAMACDVCQIVEVARRKGLRVAFIGDSTQNQIAGGLEW